jgi:hypothetical protein
MQSQGKVLQLIFCCIRNSQLARYIQNSFLVQNFLWTEPVWPFFQTCFTEQPVLANLSCSSYTECLLGGFQRALCSIFSVISIQFHFQRSNARGSEIWRHRQTRRNLEVSVNLSYFPNILTTGNAVTEFQIQKLLFTYPVPQHVQISRTSSSHIKILGARKVTWSKFHT